MLQAGTASAEKVEALSVIEQEPYLERASSAGTSAFSGRVEAKDLCFSYDGRDQVLNNVTFTIEPGSLVALVGQSGSGKTTLASLLMGLYQPTGGEFLLDGIDIRDWDLRALRKGMGSVLQDSLLFNDTIRTNVRLGRDFSDARIWAALAGAHIDDFVKSLPNQLDEPVGISGAKLSGGQKQRIAIARVFLKIRHF